MRSILPHVPPFAAGLIRVLTLGLGLGAGAALHADPAMFQYALDQSAAQHSAGHPLRARWWLRQASEHAQTPADIATLQQRFATSRQQSPLSFGFGFSIAPSDNINNGAQQSDFTLGPYRFFFPPEQMALSGVEYAARLHVDYALRQTPHAQTRLRVALFGRSYTLSDAARAQAPDMRGADYSLARAEVSLAQRFATPDFPGTTEITLGTGKQWQGGQLTFDFRTLSVAQSARLSDAERLTLSVSVEQRVSGLRPALDEDLYSVAISYRYTRANRDQIHVSLRGAFNDAARHSRSYHDYHASLGYSLDRPIMGVGLGFRAGAGHKDYDSFPISLDGRRDYSVSLGMHAVFYDMTYLGFAPDLDITARRTRSNVTRYDTSDLQIRLGFTSVF